MTHEYPIIPRCLSAVAKWIASTLKGRDMERYVGAVKLSAQSCIEDHSIVIAHRWEDAEVHFDRADAIRALSGSQCLECERQEGAFVIIRRRFDGSFYFRFSTGHEAIISASEAQLFTGFIRSWA